MHGGFKTSTIRDLDPLPVADREAARERANTILLIEDAAKAGDHDRVKELSARL